MKRIGFAFLLSLFAGAAMADAPPDDRAVKFASPQEFLQLSQTKGAVIFDARDKKDPRHLVMDKAIPMEAAEVTQEKVAALVPDKSIPILLICNFSLMSKNAAMMSRAVSATKVLSQHLADYGYTRIYILRGADTQEAHRLLSVHEAQKGTH